MIFIDTNICIALRDLDADTWVRVRALPDGPVMSMISRIELENGANAEVGLENSRRRLLEQLLEFVPVEMYTHADILAYRDIVYNLSFDRQRTLDRLIAAQAIARDATLITRNGKDFGRSTGCGWRSGRRLEERTRAKPALDVGRVRVGLCPSRPPAGRSAARSLSDERCAFLA